MPFAGFFLLLHLMRRDETKRTPGYLALAVVLGVCNCIINNPLGNSRLWGNVVLFGILSVFVDLRRPRAVLVTTLGLTTAFLLVFPYADLTRRTGRSEALLTPVQEFSASGSFSAFQTAANGLRYVDDHSLTWGRQLLGGLFTLVPRSVWPAKPPDTGFLIDPVYNRAATMWTEMHINFGVVGVVLGLGLLGVAARRCDDSFIAGRPWALILVPILSTFYFILLRGTLSAAVGTLLPILLVLLLPLVVRGKPSGGTGVPGRRRGPFSGRARLPPIGLPALSGRRDGGTSKPTASVERVCAVEKLNLRARREVQAALADRHGGALHGDECQPGRPRSLSRWNCTWSLGPTTSEVTRTIEQFSAV